MANTITFLTIQNQVYEELRANPSDKESNRVYPISLVKQSINDAQQRTLNRKNYPFLIKSAVFTSNIDTKLSADTTVGGTTLSVVDASGLKTAGKLLINENVISNTGKSSNTLTGVTGITAVHKSGNVVKQLYRINTDLSITDFNKPISVIIDDVEYKYYDYRGIQEDGFTVYNGDLYLPELDDNKIIIFKYKKQVNTLVDDDDLFEIPDDYVTLTKEYALYKCHRNVDDDRWSIALNEYNRLVKELENDYGKQQDNKYKRIKSVYE